MSGARGRIEKQTDDDCEGLVQLYQIDSFDCNFVRIPQVDIDQNVLNDQRKK